MHPWTIWGPLLALGFNNKYSNKVIAKMLHLSTEMYNNYKIRRFLGKISAETCLKMNYFGSISLKSSNAGAHSQSPFKFNE